MPAHDRKLSMAELGRVDPSAYAALERPSLCLVLDDVRSRHNVGAMFRTADAFGVERILLCGFTPCPPHREIEKTALGATGSVPWHHETDVLSAVIGLQQAGYHVLAVEQTEHATRLDEVRIVPGQRLAVVLGNELHGVSDAVIAQCDQCLVVPQYGAKHSLNVAVCAGVVLWSLMGRLRG